MTMVENYIRVNGEYLRTDQIPENEMKEISKTLAVRLAAGFGYEPVNTEEKEEEMLPGQG